MCCLQVVKERAWCLGVAEFKPLVVYVRTRHFLIFYFLMTVKPKEVSNFQMREEVL